jgi:hypothetical protein
VVGKRTNVFDIHRLGHSTNSHPITRLPWSWYHGNGVMSLQHVKNIDTFWHTKYFSKSVFSTIQIWVDTLELEERKWHTWSAYSGITHHPMILYRLRYTWCHYVNSVFFAYIRCPCQCLGPRVDSNPGPKSGLILSSCNNKGCLTHKTWTFRASRASSPEYLTMIWIITEARENVLG